MNDVSPRIPQNLKFNVMRVFDKFFNVDSTVAKGFLRFAAGGVIPLHQRNVVVRHAHAASTTSGDRLDHDRIPNLFGNLLGVLLVFHEPFGAGRRGDAGLFREVAADRLIVQCVHSRRSRPDEPDVAALANVGEVGILAQKSIARMNCIDIGDFCRTDDPINSQVAIVARTFSDTDGFVGHLDMHRIGIGLRVDCDSSNIELPAGTDDPDGDLATICN